MSAAANSAPVGPARAQAKYEPDPVRQGLALCLSGGGYRAALFHLGALTRLNELGLLARVDTISSVSGGSILAGLLAQQVPWPIDGAFREWPELVARPMREFTRNNIRTAAFLHNLLLWQQPGAAAKALANRYSHDLTNMRLTELPARPRFIFCATDLAYAVNWESGRECVGDYQAGYSDGAPANWSVARAVAASSCFPPVFDPLPIDLSADALTGGAAPVDDQRKALIAGLRLSDGGVYDNLGLESVWKDHQAVLVSDGGGTLDVSRDRGLLSRLGRYLAIVEDQVGAVRKRWLISQFLDDRPTALRGTYWGIGSAAGDYAHGAPGYGAALAKQVIAKIRTDLDAFSDAEQMVLENHGYQLADAAVRTHARSLLPAGIEPLPPQPPHPQWMDEERIRAELAKSSKRTLFGHTRSRVASRPKRPDQSTDDETERLLRRYRPVIQFDSFESYYADSVSALVDFQDQQRCSYLRRADGSAVAAAHPGEGLPLLAPEFLGRSQYADGSAVERTDYLDEPGTAYQGDARLMHDRTGVGDVVYGHARVGLDERLWLQYWFFHYYNDKAFLGVGLHEGDWEMIQIRMGPDGVPDLATFAQHSGGERSSWTDLERDPTADGPAPVVYSARGSHASHYRRGVYDAPVVPDHNDGLGRRVRPTLVVVDDDGPGWALWPGRWGSTRRREFFEADSPRGPREHGQWFDPAAFHAAAKPAAALPRGAEAVPAVALPPAPTLQVRRDGQQLIVDYSFPPGAGGGTEPVGIVVAADPAGAPGIGQTLSVPVEGGSGSVALRAPDAELVEVRATAAAESGASSATTTATTSAYAGDVGSP